jgi:hypothetical protein
MDLLLTSAQGWMEKLSAYYMEKIAKSKSIDTVDT